MKIKDFWDEYSTEIIVFILLLIVLVAVYFYAKSEGKKYVPQDIELPPDVSGGDPNFNPGIYTDPIFDDLKEVFGLHEAAPYNQANMLSNAQLAAVYNDWNHRYSEKFDGKDLAQAITGDYTLWNYEWVHIAGALVDRIEKMRDQKII